MNRMYVFSIAVIWAIGLAACHKDAIRENRSGTQYFPNSIGDYWEYEVYDSGLVRDPPDYSGPYTVRVTITGTTRLVDGKEANIWQYQYPWGKDTNYVRVVGDTIKVYDLVYSEYIEDLNYPRLIFLPPFELNKQWSGKLSFPDSFRVAGQEDITIGSSTFADCFDISHHYSGPNLEFNDHYWFKPYVGMIKIYTDRYSFGPRRIASWQLKDYGLR